MDAIDPLELPYGRPDPMLDELHQIRTEIQQELEGMNFEERAAWFADRNRARLEAMGYELRPHPHVPRAFQIVAKS